MNWHPPLTSFPVPLLFAALVFEIIKIGFKKNFTTTSQILVLLATIFIGLSFYTGYAASENADRFFKVSDDVISWHHTIGRLVLIFSIPLAALSLIKEKAIYGKYIFNVVYLLLLVTTLGLGIYSGYLGGQLVFEHGAGVTGNRGDWK